LPTQLQPLILHFRASDLPQQNILLPPLTDPVEGFGETVEIVEGSDTLIEQCQRPIHQKQPVPGLAHHAPQIQLAFLCIQMGTLYVEFGTLSAQLPFTVKGQSLADADDLGGGAVPVETQGIAQQAVVDAQHQHRVFQGSSLGDAAFEEIPARLGGMDFGIVGQGLRDQRRQRIGIGRERKSRRD